MPSGRNVIIEFLTGTASGHTNATFSIAELGPPALGLLLDLEDDEATDVRGKLTIQALGHDNGGQLSLFGGEEP
jgi:hypothetical protein